MNFSLQLECDRKTSGTSFLCKANGCWIFLGPVGSMLLSTTTTQQPGDMTVGLEDGHVDGGREGGRKTGGGDRRLKATKSSGTSSLFINGGKRDYDAT